MTDNKTFGQLKKRILDALDEYSAENGVFVTDTNRDILISRMPDEITSSLVRMYESLAVGRGRCTSRLYRPCVLIECKGTVNDGLSAELAERVAVSFCFYGSGSVIFEKDDGSQGAVIDCEGNGIRAEKRVLLTLPSAGLYTVKTEGDISLSDISIFDAEGVTCAGAVPMAGHMSFQLPDDFDEFLAIEGKEKHLCCVRADKVSGFGFASKELFLGKSEMCFEYKKSCPVITGETEDSFVFDISPLAFEALVCLSAAGLCREEESAMYTRLLYKYGDLSEGLYLSEPSGIYKRNSFFKAKKRMR